MKNYNRQTDEDLMRLVQRGDEQAFSEIYNRYSKRLLHFLYRMLKGDESRAQDLLQDVFLKVAEAPEKFNSNRNFKSWIFTVTANLCKNYFRSVKHHFAELSEHMAQERPMGERKIDDAFFKAHLNEALDQLAPVYREVFLLRYQHSMRLADIAETLDCPLGTVKSRLHSSLRILAQKLVQHQPYSL